MSFGTTPPRYDYIGTGSLADYDFGFKIYEAANLSVVKRDTLGVETTLVYLTDYTIPVGDFNNENGGTITLTAGALPADYTLTIRWGGASKQDSDIRNQGGLFLEAIEDAIDKVCRYVQGVEDLVRRSWHIPETELGTAGNTQLPSKVERMSKLAGWDAQGDPIAVAAQMDSGLTTAYSLTLLDDTTAAAARATLDASKTEPADNVFRVVGSADATKKLAFEVDALTTVTTRTLTVQDENGTIALTSEFDYANLAGSSGRMPYPAMWMQGLTYVNNAGDATNDLDIAAGQCRDATNAHNLILSALTKRSDAAWVVGTNQGALDTGAVGNSDYYIWAIKRSNTGVCDVLFSLSSTAPTMPTNYDFKRLIGWFKRVGATIVAFKTYETEGGGLELNWDSPTLDVNLANTLTTTRRTDAVKVPLNFSTIVNMNIIINDPTASPTYLYCPDMTDLAPSASVAPLMAITIQVAGANPVPMRIRTSATGTIAARSLTATIDLYAVVTLGFTWSRRN